MAQRKLTDDDMLRAIASYIDKNGWSPSYQELCDMTGLKSRSGVHRYLLALEYKGLITFGNGPRKISLTKDGRRHAEAEPLW